MVQALIAVMADRPTVAQAAPPCSPAALLPTLSVSDPAGGGALFATHLHRVRATGPVPISDPPQATGVRRVPRPYGVDVELLQGGRRTARLRVAGRCDGFAGLSSALIRCSTTKLSRAL